MAEQCAEVSDRAFRNALERHREVVRKYQCQYEPDYAQKDRPSIQEKRADCLRDAIEQCVDAGRTAAWARRRIARRAGAQPDTLRRWLERGVPDARSTARLWDACADTVEEARARDAKLGEGLARIRRGLGLTQAELARKVGVQAATLSAWERRLSEPSAQNLSRLDDTLRRLCEARG